MARLMHGQSLPEHSGSGDEAEQGTIPGETVGQETGTRHGDELDGGGERAQEYKAC